MMGWGLRGGSWRILMLSCEKRRICMNWWKHLRFSLYETVGIEVLG